MLPDGDVLETAAEPEGRSLVAPILESLVARIETGRIDRLFLALPALEGEEIRDVLKVCARFRLRYGVIEPREIAPPDDPRDSFKLRDAVPEDLVRRRRIATPDPGNPGFRGRRVLVTGAAGSIGSELCFRLLRAAAASLVLVDVDGNRLYRLFRRIERLYPEARIRIELADIRDADRIESIVREARPHDLFHTAAHKQVPLLEDSPCEAVKTNIVGTQIVARAARLGGVERFVFISTDKAVYPAGVMGASKRIGEAIVRSMALSSDTTFRTVRFGNVIGTAGSVAPIFREQIEAGGPVTVTHPEVRRFFMTMNDAVSLVMEAARASDEGLYVPRMSRPIEILELARAMISLSGGRPDTDIEIRFTGLRPGEKLSEALLTDAEAHLSRPVGNRTLVVRDPPRLSSLESALPVMTTAAESNDNALVRSLLWRLTRASSRPSSRPRISVGSSPRARRRDGSAGRRGRRISRASPDRSAT